MSDRILVKGGAILTLGTRTANLVEGDILIEGGRISEIGTAIRSRGTETIDATEAIIMPGFVDGHRHLVRSLFRNSGGAAESQDRLAAAVGEFSPEDVYASTMIGLLGAAEAGITTVVDWSESTQEDQVSAALEAHRDSGLRTVFVDTRAPAGGTVPDTGVARAWGTDADRIDPSTLASARAAGLRVHIHAGTAGVGAGTPEPGVLGKDTTVIHGTGLTGPWFAAIAEAGAALILSPASEMARGAGAPPVQDLVDLGILTGLGVGDESVAPGDIFAQMRAVISVQHATYFDLKLAGKGGLPNLLGTRQVIRYGTSDGASSVGLGTVTGSLEAGKSADITILSADRPNIYPINDPIGAVVWGMDTSNVNWVISAGRVLMRDGELTANVPDARTRAIEARERLAAIHPPEAAQL